MVKRTLKKTLKKTLKGGSTSVKKSSSTKKKKSCVAKTRRSQCNSNKNCEYIGAHEQSGKTVRGQCYDKRTTKHARAKAAYQTTRPGGRKTTKGRTRKKKTCVAKTRRSRCNNNPNCKYIGAHEQSGKTVRGQCYDKRSSKYIRAKAAYQTTRGSRGNTRFSSSSSVSNDSSL